MSGHSFLYLGQGDFAADYLGELETLPCCTCLTRSANFSLPDDVSYIVDVVLLDAGPGTHFTESSLSELVRLLAPYPVVALTNKSMEHRGITAVRAGAEGYICVDDVTVEHQESLFDHAVQRRRLQSRLSDTDVTVLSVLRNINDGVIVVDSARQRARHQSGRPFDSRPETTQPAGQRLGAVVLLHRRPRQSVP